MLFWPVRAEIRHPGADGADGAGREKSNPESQVQTQVIFVAFTRIVQCAVGR